MNSLERLYELKDTFTSVLESGDKEKCPIEELEQRVEDIKKKQTRGFITEEEADKQLTDVQKKLMEVKEKLNKKDEE